MSAILKKKGTYFAKIFAFWGKGVSIIFPLGKSLCFVQKGSLICSEESVFCIKGVPFISPKVSVLKKRGHFFLSKSQWKGASFLEKDLTSSLLQMSGGNGTIPIKDYVQILQLWSPP